MTRSCYHPTRGYCFCEFCIADYLKNAYVQANNPPKEPINFKNFKKSTQLSPLEIYCRQFSNGLSPGRTVDLQQPRAYTKTPLNSPNHLKASFDINDHQTKFLRILSDRLTQLAEQQAQYIISTNGGAGSWIGQSNNLNDSILNSSLLQRRRSRMLNNLKINVQRTRLRSSISESSGYETAEPANDSPLSNSTAHCSSAGMLFNTTGLPISSSNGEQPKNRIKFGPEDILASTNPMLLFDSNLVELTLIKKSTKQRRKSNCKKDSSSSSKVSSDQVHSNQQTENCTENKLRQSDNAKPSSSGALSNVTNTLKNTSRKFIMMFILFGLTLLLVKKSMNK